MRLTTRAKRCSPTTEADSDHSWGILRTSIDDVDRERGMSEDIKSPDLGKFDPAAEKAAVDSEGRGEGRTRARRKRKVSYLTINKIESVDYKDIGVLRRFLTDRGKILASRQTGNTAKQQRQITQAIKRAREMALLPFVVREFSDEGRRGRASQENR